MFSSIRGHLKLHRGGYGMLLHCDRASMVMYCVEMAHTRGGGASPVAPPRIYTNPLEVKVRKVHGGYVYQPPNLKTCSYLVLDRYRTKAKLPRSRLYESPS